jgi:hypothetical protein
VRAHHYERGGNQARDYFVHQAVNQADAMGSRHFEILDQTRFIATETGWRRGERLRRREYEVKVQR